MWRRKVLTFFSLYENAWSNPFHKDFENGEWVVRIHTSVYPMGKKLWIRRKIKIYREHILKNYRCQYIKTINKNVLKWQRAENMSLVLWIRVAYWWNIASVKPLNHWRQWSTILPTASKGFKMWWTIKRTWTQRLHPTLLSGYLHVPSDNTMGVKKLHSERKSRKTSYVGFGTTTGERETT